MGTYVGRSWRRSDLGSVAIYIISPTRTVLVIDESFTDAHWKLPCGGVEDWDGGSAVAAITDAAEQTKARIIAAAIREAREETGGIELVPAEITLVEEQARVSGFYYPHFCVACVSEEKLDTHRDIGDEDGKKLTVADFYRGEMQQKILERHRTFVKRVEREISAAP